MRFEVETMENENINQQESLDNVDFDILFDEDDIKTWGFSFQNSDDSEFIAAYEIWEGK